MAEYIIKADTIGEALEKLSASGEKPCTQCNAPRDEIREWTDDIYINDGCDC